MKTTKFIGLTIAALMSIVLYSAAQAQTRALVSFKGIEVSTGHQESDEAYGWMCYAKTTGALPGNFTLSIDYAGIKAPGTSSEVTNGAWALPVYGESTFSTGKPIKLDAYQGVVFGIVEAGALMWDKAGTTATVELKMLIKGGTQAMGDLRGTAVLYGTVSYDEKGAGAFEGTIFFEFQ